MPDQMPCCPSHGAPAPGGTPLMLPRLGLASSLLIHASSGLSRLTLPSGTAAVLLADGRIHVAVRGAPLRHPFALVGLLEEVPASQICGPCFAWAFYAPHAHLRRLGGPAA